MARNKAGRQLDSRSFHLLMERLGSHEGVDTQEFAEECGKSARTVRRWIALARDLGHRIVVENGRHRMLHA